MYTIAHIKRNMPTDSMITAKSDGFSQIIGHSPFALIAAMISRFAQRIIKPTHAPTMNTHGAQLCSSIVILRFHAHGCGVLGLQRVIKGVALLVVAVALPVHEGGLDT